MAITGGTGTVNITVIKAVTKVENNPVGNQDSVLRLGTTGKYAFVISGDTCHSVLILPAHITFAQLNGQQLTDIQNFLHPFKIIIIDEMSMMGKQTLYYIDQILKQASGKMDQPVGSFGIIFVGNFQKLPPVTEIVMCKVDVSASYLLYEAIKNDIMIQTSH